MKLLTVGVLCSDLGRMVSCVACGNINMLHTTYYRYHSRGSIYSSVVFTTFVFLSNLSVQELRLQNDTLDKERDFYFSKLRDIEMESLAMPPTSQVASYVLEILKATPDDFKQSLEPEMHRRETFGRR